MWTLDRRSSVPSWRFDPSPTGATLAFSTRRGGVSTGPYRSLNLGRSTRDRPEAVAENRRLLLQRLGLEPSRLATAGQVHGNAVSHVERPGLHAECDVLVSTTPGIALAVTAADCLPILYAAPGAVAAAHSGWRGTAASAISGAPAAVSIHLGPGIRGCCYQVGPEVAGRFPAAAIRRVGEALHLDLPTATRLRLLEAGASPEGIHDVGACTACAPRWYFSHRRDHGLTGRHWGLATLRAPHW